MTFSSVSDIIIRLKNGGAYMVAIKKFFSKNVVLVVALIAAFITMLVVKPDTEYIGYFDFKTLTCLFCVLAVVNALNNIGLFTFLAKKIITVFHTKRKMIIALVWITLVGSMFIANDMALLTFLPLGYMVLEKTNDKKNMAFTFIMQTVAANLGGMLTPFGNPQNLYIYSHFNVPTGEFVSIMLLPFIVSVTAVTLCCFFIKNEEIEFVDDGERIEDKPRLVLYLALFVLAIVIVFNIIPYVTGLLVIIPVLLFADRDALKKTDYGLLMTFAAFFVFSGNLSRVDAVRELFSFILEQNTLLVSAISCQFISNVPTAVLLSQFTDNYRELLMGVNIGGTGTLISSLASLITFREFQKRNPGNTGKYIKLFTIINFAFLIGLLIFCELIK